MYTTGTRDSNMCCQEYLMEKFQNWKPPAPEVVERSKGAITMSWDKLEPFNFLSEHLLYTVERNNKIAKWVVVYSGGKTTKRIDNLAPRHPHRFRLKVILKSDAVTYLNEKAISFYKNEKSIYEIFDKININRESNGTVTVDNNANKEIFDCLSKNGDTASNRKVTIEDKEFKVNINDAAVNDVSIVRLSVNNYNKKQKWLESMWSDETWTNTDTDGTSAVCFSMAVRCGYIKQVQAMLEERSELISIINSSTGFTPLATAVRKGNINMVKVLVSCGADVNQASSTGQTPLHLAVLSGNIALTEFLLEKEADFQCRDWNGLRVEHYAVDSCNLHMIRFVLDHGGDVTLKDNNGWTSLFRAVCQEANIEVIEELIRRGSDVNAVDHAGLPLASIARLLKNKSGSNRDSILRLIDSNYPHEKALANFTRLTKKAYNFHSLFKLN